MKKVLCRYAASRCCYGPSGCVHCHGRAVTAGTGQDNGYRVGSWTASLTYRSTQLQISNPIQNQPSHFSKHHTQKKEQSFAPQKLHHFKTSLTSPRPQSRLQTQTGCWRQRTLRRPGRGSSPDFVPAAAVQIQRLRGGRSGWLQGSSWAAHALRGNHSIQLKLEKRKLYQKQSCFVRIGKLCCPRERTSFSADWPMAVSHEWGVRVEGVRLIPH